MSQVSEEKRAIVDDTVKLLDDYKLIGAADLTKVGKESMPDEEIAGNVDAVLNSLTGVLKRGANNIKSIYLKLTMGPAVKLE